MNRASRHAAKIEPRGKLCVASSPSVVGPLFAAASSKGIVAFSFHKWRDGVDAIQRDHPGFTLEMGAAGLKHNLQRVASRLKLGMPPPPLPLHLQGTPFQCMVWKALLRIPHGATQSYAEVARRIGCPRATRAVGAACAHNPIALLVPCHRVVRGDGHLGGYAWGLRLKRRLLALEQTARASEK
ncbi:MAG: methylated-DNA--[protein]-cysteine S-methyltransferase [Verrucomicrobia bacterium]|nr:methylated-DNA--[protein]-cysteine S-methyltransferase [Verrucomicrobiota bacterium]